MEVQKNSSGMEPNTPDPEEQPTGYNPKLMHSIYTVLVFEVFL